jgi:arylsulfatase A-like enzyme
VRAFDREIGAFLEDLRASGVLDDTLVILTSDHGEELLEHGDWDHGYALYDEQMRVPLLVRWPDGRGAGRRVDQLVSLVDLMPTLAGIARVSLPKGLAGHDLGALFSGRAVAGREMVFAEGVKWQPGVRAVRTRERKLMIDERSGAVRLYDVKSDPEERTNLAERESEQRRRLEQLLERQRRELARAPRLEAESVPVSPELAARLESLGYVGEEPKALPEGAGRGKTSDVREDLP